MLDSIYLKSFKINTFFDLEGELEVSVAGNTCYLDLEEVQYLKDLLDKIIQEELKDALKP